MRINNAQRTMVVYEKKIKNKMECVLRGGRKNQQEKRTNTAAYLKFSEKYFVFQCCW